MKEESLDHLTATAILGIDTLWGGFDTTNQAGDVVAKIAEREGATRGALYKYIRSVRSASEGCVTDE